MQHAGSHALREAQPQTAHGNPRTMLCTVILLCFIVYFLSVLLVHLLGSDIDAGNELVAGQEILFATLPKAMFTVFRCLLVGDCAAPNGTPIALQLSESIGWPFL